MTNSKKEIDLHPEVVKGSGSKFGTETVPVLGAANGSSEAVVLNFDEPIGFLPEHPNQHKMKGSFALYTRGESMSPRYEPGDPVYAIANKSPAKEQDCIIEMKNGESYLKRFVKQTDISVICRQFSPAKEWRRSISEVKAIHAVVGRG